MEGKGSEEGWKEGKWKGREERWKAGGKNEEMEDGREEGGMRGKKG